MIIRPNLKDRFPKYHISAKWNQNTYKGNSTSFYQMFKRQKDEKQQQTYVENWWKKYKKPDYKLIELKIEFIEIETWCLGWFGHWTFDIGLNDEQILQSFQEYVDRKEELNYLAKRKGAEYEPWCLMGADERFRWRGEHEGDPAPCKCVHCKKQGVIRIGH